jgi:hypothetical protein
MNASILSGLNAVMAALSVIAAATWSTVVPADWAFYIITGVLALNAGLHALTASTK